MLNNKIQLININYYNTDNKNSKLDALQYLCNFFDLELSSNQFFYFKIKSNNFFNKLDITIKIRLLAHLDQCHEIINNSNDYVKFLEKLNHDTNNLFIDIYCKINNIKINNLKDKDLENCKKLSDNFLFLIKHQNEDKNNKYDEKINIFRKFLLSNNLELLEGVKYLNKEASA